MDDLSQMPLLTPGSIPAPSEIEPLRAESPLLMFKTWAAGGLVLGHGKLSVLSFELRVSSCSIRQRPATFAFQGASFVLIYLGRCFTGTHTCARYLANRKSLESGQVGAFIEDN